MRFFSNTQEGFKILCVKYVIRVARVILAIQPDVRVQAIVLADVPVRFGICSSVTVVLRRVVRILYRTAAVVLVVAVVIEITVAVLVIAVAVAVCQTQTAVVIVRAQVRKVRVGIPICIMRTNTVYCLETAVFAEIAITYIARINTLRKQKTAVLYRRFFEVLFCENRRILNA